MAWCITLWHNKLLLLSKLAHNGAISFSVSHFFFSVLIRIWSYDATVKSENFELFQCGFLHYSHIHVYLKVDYSSGVWTHFKQTFRLSKIKGSNKSRENINNVVTH